MSKKLLMGCLQVSILINFFLYMKIYKESDRLNAALENSDGAWVLDQGFTVEPEKIYFLGRYCSIGENFMFVKIEGNHFKLWHEVRGDFEVVQNTRPNVMGEISVIDSFHANFKVLYADETSDIRTYKMQLEYVAQTGKVVSYSPVDDKALRFDLRNCY